MAELRRQRPPVEELAFVDLADDALTARLDAFRRALDEAEWT
jgi:hypothetical protein